MVCACAVTTEGLPDLQKERWSARVLGRAPVVIFSKEPISTAAVKMDELVKIEGTFDAEALRVLRETPGLTASPVANEDLTGFGNFVSLEIEVEGETYYQVLAHMESFDPGIDQGSVVDVGTLLGLMGSTGSSTGPHVHWEIRREDAVTVDGDGGHGFSTWYPADEEEMN